MGLGRSAVALGLSWLALVAADEPPRLEDAVLIEVNYVRTHPHDYADELRRYREFFDGRVVRLPGDEVGQMMREGTSAVDEAIAFLDRQAPSRRSLMAKCWRSPRTTWPRSRARPARAATAQPMAPPQATG